MTDSTKTEPTTEAGRLDDLWSALLDDLWVTPNDTRLTSEILRKHRPAIEAEARASLDVDVLAPHPGENHEFRMTCLRCGERGMLHVAFITDNEVVRVEDRVILAEKQP